MTKLTAAGKKLAAQIKSCAEANKLPAPTRFEECKFDDGLVGFTSSPRAETLEYIFMPGSAKRKPCLFTEREGDGILSQKFLRRGDEGPRPRAQTSKPAAANKQGGVIQDKKPSLGYAKALEEAAATATDDEGERRSVVAVLAAIYKLPKRQVGRDLKKTAVAMLTEIYGEAPPDGAL